MRSETIAGLEISTDGQTVWINREPDGFCVARFSRGGAEIGAQTWAPGALAWDGFADFVARTFGVDDVLDRMKPAWAAAERQAKQ